MAEAGSYPTASNPLAGNERILADQGGATIDITPAQIAAYAASLTTAPTGQAAVASTVLQTMATPQLIGPLSPVTGSNISAGTYVLATPALYGGYLTSFQVFGQVAGLLKVKRFRPSGGTLVWVSEFEVVFPSGLHTFQAGVDFAGLALNAGDYLGFYTVSGNVAYNTVAGNASPYYVASGDVTTSFTAGAVGTALELEINFTLAGFPPGLTQKLGAWPDPFFRHFAISGANQAGAPRWWTGTPGDYSSVALVQSNALADGGNILVKTGHTPLVGPVLDVVKDAGAALNDPFTVYVAVSGSGPGSGEQIQVSARFDTGTDGAFVGGQLNFTVLNSQQTVLVGSSNIVIMALTTTVPATAMRLAIYPYTTAGGAGHFNVYAVWGGRGAPQTLPIAPGGLGEQLYLLDQVADLENRVIDLEQGSDAPNEPVFTLPANLYAVVGTELCLAHDGICSAHSDGLSGMAGYSVSIVGPAGLNEDRQFRWTPVSGNVGTNAFVAKLFDDAGNLVTTRSFTINVGAATPLGSAKQVLEVGDSITELGFIPQTTQAKFAALGGTVPTFVGTQGTSPAKYEAYGGKTYAFYAGSGGTTYQFSVSGVGTITAGDVYAVGGVNYTIYGSNLSGGAGTIQVTGASAPPASGTLTLVSGTGDATIVFSASATIPGNPFWNSGTGQVDFTHYRSVNGISAVIDVLKVQLGVNDVFGEAVQSSGQIATIITNAKTLFAAFLADNAAGQIIATLPTLCGNTSDGFAANYGASYSREVYEANIFALRAALLAAFDNGAYNANVHVGAGGLAIDRYYGYGTSNVVVSARISTIVAKMINAVHPIQAGCQQIGDVDFAEMLALL